jgi:transcriptional regulator with XRE-family HTH domain
MTTKTTRSYVITEKGRLLRAKTGLPLREIAKQLGYTNTMLSLVCSGKAQPSWDLARKLGQLCDKPAEYFLLP